MGHPAYVNWVMQISKLAGNRACKERSAVFKMSICDTCGNYQYDEDYEYYVCMVDLDEDEMSRFCRVAALNAHSISQTMSTGLSGNRCEHAEISLFSLREIC